MSSVRLPADGRAGAEFSDDRRFRYLLWRIWGGNPGHPISLRLVHFCMLNPSIADETELDPTLRRCRGFAEKWNMDGMLITNLRPLVATDPRQLLAAPDARGPRDAVGWYINDTYIANAAGRCEFTVVGWGANAGKLFHGDRVLRFYYDLLAPHGPITCLGTTKAGHPLHPLYIDGETALLDWTPP